MQQDSLGRAVQLDRDRRQAIKIRRVITVTVPQMAQALLALLVLLALLAVVDK
jgi:hypothetical protein